MKIGILGGSFNPIHNGHLILAESIRSHLGLDRVIFIPLGVAPHKKNDDILNSKDRMNIVELAISTNDYFEMSDMEINREGTTYTIDTMRELKEDYPEDDLYFMIGGDSLFQLEGWKDFKELISLCGFSVVGRCKKGKEAFNYKVNEIREKYPIKLEVVDSPIVEISSTDIRDNLKNGISIKYLVPELVEDYLIEHSLYL